ncbi:MAG: S8 family serine peptidase [Bdellovibrionia bacterium]
MARGVGQAFLVTALTLWITAAQAGEVLRLKNGNVRAQELQNSLRINAFSSSLGTASGQTRFYIVQFKSDLTETGRALLSAAGLKLHGYVPDDAVIVEAATAKSIAAVQSAPSIQAVIPYTPELRVSDEILNATSNMVVHVRLFNTEDSSAVTAKLKAAGAVNVHATQGKSIYAQVPASALNKVVKVDGVEWVEKYVPLIMHDFDAQGFEPMAGDFSDLTGYESGTKVMNFDAAWAAGVAGQSQIAAIADTGLDTGTPGQIHGDFANIFQGIGFANGGKWMDVNGHGTHVAGSVAGQGKMSKGMVKGGAHGAKIFFEGLWDNTSESLAVPASLSALFGPAMQAGARVHSNSWGSPRNAYDNFAIQVDEFMWKNPEMLVLFAAGNSGVDRDKNGRVDEGSLGSPATAKNCLSVGASENLVLKGGRQATWGELKPPGQAEGKWPAEPMASDKLSDNPNGIAAFSSRGPTADGRIKPDVVAPGVNILSARSTQTKPDNVMWGAYNDQYLYAGGTSMATPLTAGAATVVRDYLARIGLTRPSAALVKGILMHSATDLFPGQFPAGPKQELPAPRPNVHEGFGRVDVKSAISLTAPQLKDETVGVGAGEAKTFAFKLQAGRKFVATLSYTDAPGVASAAKVLVNDLDISVVDPKGRAVSKADRMNNVELVEIANPVAGEYKVTITGIKVPQGKNGKQPYALIVSAM